MKGEGVTKNTETGIDWMSKAGEQGLIAAQLELGDMYREGSGIPADPDKATEWYARAAEQGDALAQYALGLAYLKGEGVTKSTETGTDWLSKAGAQGLIAAKNKLGDMYREAREIEPIGAASTGQEPATLAVLTLYHSSKDSSPEAELEVATQSIVDILTEQYGLSVSRWTRADKFLHGDELLPAAKKTGARYVFQGSFNRKGDQIEIGGLFYDVRGRPYGVWSDLYYTDVDRDLSWVIDKFARQIDKYIDAKESSRPPPTHFEAVSDGQVVADSRDDFGDRGGLTYLRNSSEPFTGVIKRWWPGENPSSEKHYAGGRLHGSFNEWRRDGQVSAQGQMVDGQRDGSWYERTGMRLERVCYRMDARIACDPNRP